MYTELGTKKEAGSNLDLLQGILLKGLKKTSEYLVLRQPTHASMTDMSSGSFMQNYEKSEVSICRTIVLY
jgi:hypothetical protein